MQIYSIVNHLYKIDYFIICLMDRFLKYAYYAHMHTPKNLNKKAVLKKYIMYINKHH